jgi:hypothetical protein
MEQTSCGRWEEGPMVRKGDGLERGCRWKARMAMLERTWAVEQKHSVKILAFRLLDKGARPSSRNVDGCHR